MSHALNPAVTLALDASARSYDANGRLHISKTHITKATVNPYFGMEIPNSVALGLDPQKVYYMLRSPEELAKAAPTFERIQILIKHKPILNTDPPKLITVGTTGSDISFEAPYLNADVCLWDDQAIAGIETKTQHEWSCAYRYVAVMTAGIYEGQRYDGIMTEIRADHLAIVEDGRAGSDVIAADQEINIMPKTKLGTALIATLGGMSAKLALDSALPALVGQADKKTFNKADVSAKLIAMDADLKPAAVAAVFDSLLALDEEKKEVAEDADEHPKDCDCKECKMAKDEDEAEKKKIAEDAEEKAEKKLEGAMDSFRKDLREADEARRAVRPVVGDVIAQDSAEGIYGFALDHLKVDHAGVTGVPALKSLFTLAQSKANTAPVAIAQDSAGAAAKFPHASRFRQA